ncbi:MAG: hypothetical protein AB2L24_05745 [Mangrovibacterium sp.]
MKKKRKEDREISVLLNLRKPLGILLLIPLLLINSVTYGKNKERKVSASESILMHDEFISLATYKELAKDQAIIKALENEFGSTVVNNYEQITETNSTNQQINFHQDIRHNYLNTFPNGRWIKFLKEPVYQQKQDERGNTWMECSVTGLAESIESAKVNFISKTLDGEDIEKDFSESFTSGENGYIYFKSPVNGYLAIYFDDLIDIQRCLPYNAINEACFPVKANKDYVFFSTDKCNYLDNKETVDEFELFTRNDFENNRFYILFSPIPIQAPLLEKPKKLEGGYFSFWHTESHLFMQWLEDTRLRNKDLQVQIIWVTIKKKEI